VYENNYIIEVDKNYLKGDEKIAVIGHEAFSQTEFLHPFEIKLDSQ
jgi:hypothetical protein